MILVRRALIGAKDISAKCALLGLFLATADPGFGNESHRLPGTVVFNIAAQPLATALEQYGNATGWEVLYNSNLAAGRLASRVEGRYTPQLALVILLARTGLIARYTDMNSFVLVPAPVPAVIEKPDFAGVQRRQMYYGHIQDSLKSALCEDGDARPGRDRIAAQFWLGPRGEVVRYQRLTSTGDQLTDGRIDGKLANLQIGIPPPTDFAEPVTIIIQPKAHPVSGCDNADAAFRAGP